MLLAVWLIASTHWMLLHGVENQSYWVNMDQVTTLRQLMPGDLQRFAKGVQCVVTLGDGKIVAVTESCNTVYQLIAGAK